MESISPTTNFGNSDADTQNSSPDCGQSSKFRWDIGIAGEKFGAVVVPPLQVGVGVDDEQVFWHRSNSHL